MPIEIVNQQLRIRIRNPKLFKEFRTDDVGDVGKLQRVAGYNGREWKTQSFRLNLDDYENMEEVEKDINSINELSYNDKLKAVKLARGYFN